MKKNVTSAIALKTNNQIGKWVAKPLRSVIVVCSACENKYIATREKQTMCVECIYGRTTK